MISGNRYQKLDCKTLDGTSIHWWFHAANERAPAIIMSHGVRHFLLLCKPELWGLTSNQFNCAKEILITETAETFQSMGYNVLIYDPRNVGESEGLPRNEISPLQQAEDISG